MKTQKKRLFPRKNAVGEGRPGRKRGKKGRKWPEKGQKWPNRGIFSRILCWGAGFFKGSPGFCSLGSARPGRGRMLLLPLICSICGRGLYPSFVPLSAHGGCFFVGLLLGSCRKGGVLFCLVEVCFRGIDGGVFLLGLDRFGVVRGCAGDVGWGPVGLAWIWIGYG